MSGGGVKVAVRVRPFNQREIDMNAKLCVQMNGPTTTIVNPQDGNKRDFAFDYSFWSHDGFQNDENGYSKAVSSKYADQQYVFQSLGKQVLDNAWKGYHCCLFAYGQTGSGKSYSMIGYGANKGIVPIAMEQIFRRVTANTDENLSYQINFSMIEIYNEKTQDLLINPQKRPAGGLKIRQSQLLGVYVEGLTKHPVGSYKEIQQKMDEGNKHRTVGATLMNATSSRAHTIIQVEFKQVTTFQGRKAQKLSVINLVDLAGSQKAGQTGAQGDRLKEGCMINQSLTSLGQVISALADLATGKAKKGAVIPYRNSALTRILQNALGGNSKTIMICAVSPATVNYQESMSTLRYADRAKKIKNVAEINQSPQDKLIRELKEENERLKKQLASGGGGGGGAESENFGLQQQGDARVAEMQALLKKNQEAMAQMESDWLKKLEASQKEAEQKKSDQNREIPHLTNLNEDPQYSGKVYHNFQSGKLRVGRKNQSPENQVILGGIGIKNNHAVFQTDKKGRVILKPHDKGCESIFVNGEQVIQPRVLEPNDRIIFGTNSVFLFRDPENQGNAKTKLQDIDMEFAQREKMQISDKANKQQQQEAQARELEQMKKKLLQKEKELEEEKKKADQEIRAKQKELEEEGSNAAKEAELKRLEQERERKQQEKQMVLRQEQENMQKRAKEKAELEQQLAEFLPLIHEANLCSNELKRKFKFSAQLQTKLADSITNPIEAMKHRRTQIACKVDNYQDGYSYIWSSQKFKNRLYIIRDIINEYFDTQQVPHLEREQDPWWDPPEAQLIGYSYASLQNLSYLIQNENTSSIIGLGAGKCGHLTYAILPCGQNGMGEPDDDLLPEQSADELIGKRFDFNVQIKSAKDLPLDLCNDVYVTYQFFLDDQVYETQKAQGHQANPVFDFSHHHTVDMATKGLIDYLKSSNLKFNVYGQSSGIKKRAVMQEQKKMPKGSGKQKNQKAKPVVAAAGTQNSSMHQDSHQNNDGVESGSKRQKIKEVGGSKSSGCCTVF